MANIKATVADLIYGRGIIAAESLASKLRRLIITKLSDLWVPSHFARTDEAVSVTQRVLGQSQAAMAEAILNTNIASWLAGAAQVGRKIPQRFDNQFFAAGGDALPPWRGTLVDDSDEPPVVRFPKIDQAVKDLFSRKIVTRPDFDQLEAVEKTRAFTIAGDMTEKTIDKVRDVLARSVEDGPSLRVFRERLGEGLESSFIGPGHLETVYRNGVQTAYATGHDRVANNPIIKKLFPYQAYLCINDARCRPTHRALTKLGISGTNVYRRDDPFWRIFRGPWDFGCRCSVALLTLEAAARMGAMEAVRWLESGNEPLEPDWRLEHIPFRPTNDFVSPGAALAA